MPLLKLEARLWISLALEQKMFYWKIIWEPKFCGVERHIMSRLTLTLTWCSCRDLSCNMWRCGVGRTILDMLRRGTKGI